MDKRRYQDGSCAAFARNLSLLQRCAHVLQVNVKSHALSKQFHEHIEGISGDDLLRDAIPSEFSIHSGNADNHVTRFENLRGKLHQLEKQLDDILRKSRGGKNLFRKRICNGCLMF